MTTTASAAAPPAPVLRVTGLRRQYRIGDQTVTALDGVDLVRQAGTFTAVMGPSGSGKSTLLHCAAGLDRPDAGEVELLGTRVDTLSERAAARLRRGQVGFVFQSLNLMPQLTAAQNVALPLRLAGQHPGRAAVHRALERVGLAERAGHRPGQLSGGQQQRVALARALLGRPRMLFADEPTGALDSAATREVLGLLRDLVDGHGQTVLLVTHDPAVAARADQVIFLSDGRLAGLLDRPTAAVVAGRLAALEQGAVRC